MVRRAVIFAYLLARIAFSQTATFKADVSLLSVSVRVTDSRGREIGGLPESTFTLLEDNVPQRISFFAAEKQPVSMGILLDTSSSMRAGGKLEHAKAALRELIAAGHPDNELFYMEFGNKLGEIVELSGDPQRFFTAVSGAAAARSGTALYDAVAVALCRLRNARNMRQALIVITDGADQDSRLNAGVLIREVQSSRAQVYVVGDFSAEERAVFEQRQETVTLASGREIDNPILVFERLARESGAECYFPITAGGVKRAIEAVAKELQTQYTLAYYPESSAKPYHHIQVKLRVHGLKVFTRRGFSTAEAGAHFSVDACAISPQEHPYPYESKIAHSEGGLVYHEDFMDPRSGWPLNESLWYGSGEYHIVRKDPVQLLGEGSVCAYGPWWSDGQFSVSVKLSKPSNHAGWITSPGAGLVFRLNDRGYYALLIGLAPGVHAKLVAKRFNVPQAVDLMPWTKVDDRRSAGPSEWNRLGVECHGDLVILSVNNREIGRLRDARFEDGYVGMTLFGPGHAVFRDLMAEDSK
jgi:Ca-activated chloride channel family protein